MTDLQEIRPLRDTNRRVKPLETQEAASQSPLLVTYSNPQNVWFAGFSYSLDQKKRNIRMPRQHGIASLTRPTRILRRKGGSGGRQCKSAKPTETVKSHRRRSGTGVEKRHQSAQGGWPEATGERGHNDGAPLVSHKGKANGWER